MANSKELVVFKNALNGYNREDVNNYISKMNNEFRKNEENYRANLNEQDNEICLLKDKISALEESVKNSTPNNGLIDSLSQELQKYRSSVSQQAKEIASLETEITNLMSLNQTCNDQITTLNQKLQDAVATINQYHTESKTFIDKAKLYDKMSSQIGDMIIAANSTAEETISNAKYEANEILAKANLEAGRIVKNAEALLQETKLKATEKANKLLNQLTQNSASMLESYNKDLAVSVSDTKNALSNVISDLHKKNASLDSRMSDIKNNLTQFLQGELAKISTNNLKSEEVVDLYLDLSEDNSKGV